MVELNLSIKGMHCNSCAIIITEEVKKLEGINNIEVSYTSEKAKIDYNPDKIMPSKIIETITNKGYSVTTDEEKIIKEHNANDLANSPSENYSAKNHEKHETGKKKKLKHLHDEKEHKPSSSFWSIILLIGILGGLYYMAQLIPFSIPSNISFIAALGIGLIVSLHCVGMCSSFVMSYSVKAKEDRISGKKMHLMYNSGRVLAYTLIGGVLGLLGSFFVVNQSFRGILAIFAGVFMILFALNLIGVFRLNLTPNFVYKIVGKIIYENYTDKDAENEGKNKGPFVIGLMNGLMPCGPLIAMELYALSTGSFFTGAGIMFFFGLGTVPAMFGLGTIIEKLSKDWTSKMLKVSGIIILILALLTINRGMAFLGAGDIGSFVKDSASSLGIFTSAESSKSASTDFSPEIVDGKQIIRMDVTSGGYSPNKLQFKPGIPIKWVINVKTLTGCNNKIIVPDYNLELKLKEGENVLEFTPKDGDNTISFSCWMGMLQGTFVSTNTDINTVSVPKSSGCGCGGAG